MVASVLPDGAADASRQRSLAALVGETRWAMTALRAARALRLHAWCVGAGAVRSLVWDRLHGRPAAPPAGDIDLAFHEPAPGRSGADFERALAARLEARTPEFTWDVVNQAGPHHAFPAAGGGVFESLVAGVASWPETATCVGVWLDVRGVVQVVAPLGLADLFEMVVRYNPACGDPDLYLDRMAAKRWRERWPRLDLHAPEDG